MNTLKFQPAIIRPELTIKTLEQGVKCVQSWCLTVNVEHISRLVLVFLLLILSKQMPTEKSRLTQLLCTQVLLTKLYFLKL